jgi:hypothetical protein
VVQHLTIYIIRGNQRGRSEPTPGIVRSVLSASAFSPSKLCNVPLTVNVAEPAQQKHQSAWHGKTARKVSRHTHNFKKNVWPLFLDRVIPSTFFNALLYRF